MPSEVSTGHDGQTPEELRRELAEAREQQAATAEILRVISSSPMELQRVFAEIAASAARLCDASNAGVLQVEGDHLRVVAHHGPIPTEQGRIPVKRGVLIGRAVLDRKTLHVADLQAETDEYPEGSEFARRLGHRTILAIPLIRAGEANGAIFIRRMEVRPFTNRQIDLLKTFADQAVIAIENTRLFEAEQASKREVQESLEYQTAISDVLGIISRSPTDVQPVFDTIAKSALHLCAGTFSTVLRFDGRLIHFAAAHGMTPAALEGLRSTYPLPPGRAGATTRAIETGALAEIPDIDADPAFEHRKLTEAQKVKSVVSVPMLKDGRPIGTITVGQAKVGNFPHRQIALLKTFADQAVIVIENTRLFEAEQASKRELQESLEYQTATSEVLGVISRSPSDLQPVLDAIVSTAARLCEADFADFRLLRDGLYHIAATTADEATHVRISRNNPIAPGRNSISGRAALERRTVHVADIQTDPEYTYVPGPSYPVMRTILGVPLLRDGVAIGVIVLFNSVVRPFSQKQIDLVTTFASQAVIAINNVGLFEEVQARTRELTEALEYQTATSDVLSVISRSPNKVQPVLDTIVQTAQRLCQSDRAQFFMLEHGKYRLAAYIGANPEFLRYLSENPISAEPGSGSTTGKAARERRTIHVPDTFADPEFASSDLNRTGRGRSVLGVPLLRGDVAIGVILVARDTVKPFTDAQIELVETFADQALIAIENTRLFEEVQARTRETAEALEYQTATSDVLDVISRSPSELQPVFDVIVQTAARLCAAEYAFIAKLADGKLVLAAANQVEAEHIQFLARNPVAIDRSSVAGRVALERSSIHVSDVLADPEFRHLRWQKVGKQRTVLGVPLLREDRLFGVLILARTAVLPFTENQADLVSTFADQAVIAIENTRLFEAEQASKRELQESLEYQTATSEVLAVISSSRFALEPVLQSVVDTAARLCRANNAIVYTLEDGACHFAAGHGHDDKVITVLRTTALPIGPGTAVGRAIAARATVHIDDALADPLYKVKDLAKLGQTRSVLGVPLMRDDEAIGAIALTRNRIEPFDAREIGVVTTFADQAVIAIENTRLLNDLRESLAQQTATAGVLRVISQSPTDLQRVLDTIVETAQNLSSSYDAAIMLRHGEGLRVRAHKGPIPVRTDWPTLSRGSVAARSVLDRAAVHVSDLSIAGTEFPEGQAYAFKLGHRTILAVPLLLKDEAIGTMVVRRREVRPFTDKESELLKAFADQAVIAIENTRLFEAEQASKRELQESLEYQTATSEVLNVISRSPTELQPVLDSIAATAARLCESVDAQVVRVQDGKLAMVAQYGSLLRPPPTFPGLPLTRGSVSGRAVLDQQTVHVDDLAALVDTEYPDAKASQIAVGHRTTLAAPLLRRGESLGAITLRRTQVRPFSDKQRILLQTFADQAVIAIENTRLFEEVQARTRELTESLEYQTATSEVLSVISSSQGELDSVFRTVLENAVRVCGATFGTLHRYDGNKFYPAAKLNTPPALAEFQRQRGPFLPERGNPLDRMLQAKKVVHVVDDLAEQVPSPAGRLGGARSLIAAPMLREDELLGAIFVYRQEVRPFTDKQIDLMTNFARQAVIAIENTRLLNELRESLRQLEIASQHKSQFVANMSHELRTPLAAILGYAELMQEGFYGTLSDKSTDALTRIRSNGKHLLGLINTVLDIAKIESGQFSLNLGEYAIESVVETVRAATESLAATKKLALTTDIEKRLPVGLGDEQRLTQVLLNLVGNALKFTDTGEVCITATAMNSHFTVSVTDTGPGIAQDQLTRVFDQFHQVDNSNTKAKGGTGLGLAIAKQIVEMHGGRIWVESTVGKGSTFQMELPIRAEIRKAAE